MLRTVIFHLGGIPPWQAAIQAPEMEKAGRESSRSCSLQQAQFVPGQLPVPVGRRTSAQGCAVVGAAAAGPGSRPPRPGGGLRRFAALEPGAWQNSRRKSTGEVLV